MGSVGAAYYNAFTNTALGTYTPPLGTCGVRVVNQAAMEALKAAWCVRRVCPCVRVCLHNGVEHYQVALAPHGWGGYAPPSSYGCGCTCDYRDVRLGRPYPRCA